jgi:hypothetical protein
MVVVSAFSFEFREFALHLGDAGSIFSVCHAAYRPHQINGNQTFMCSQAIFRSPAKRPPGRVGPDRAGASPAMKLRLGR